MAYLGTRFEEGFLVEVRERFRFVEGLELAGEGEDLEDVEFW